MKTNSPIRCLQGRFLMAFGLLLTTVFSVHATFYENTVLTDQPLAFYPLDLTIDNNSVATDLSGNGNNSTYYSLSSTAGPSTFIPNAAYFVANGTESFVDLSSGPTATIMNFSGTITMEAWVQTTNLTQSPADILGKGYDASLNDDELVLRASSGGYYGGTYNNINNGASASGGTVTTNWTYVVSTYDGTNWNMYVNGEAVGHGADTNGAINFSDPWAIGTGSADGFSRFYQGTICQVALYTNALSPARVLAHYYAGLFGVTSINSSIPLILNQPQPQATYPGGSVTFSVTAVSASTVTNEWLKNGNPIPGQTNSSLTLNNVLSTDVANYSVILGNANGVTNSTMAGLSLLASGNSLQWTANNNNGSWDTDTTANWLNLSNSQQTIFNTGDKVLFDDTVGVPTAVTVNGTVAPSSIVVDSSTNDFTFTGGSSGGSISGSGSLLKEGSSLLTDYASGALTGPAIIGGGTIYAGNNSFNSVSQITISNNATFDIAGGTLNNFKPIIVSGTGQNGGGALYNSYADYPSESLAVTLAGNTTFGGSARWDFVNGSLSGPYNVAINWGSGGYGEWNTVAIAQNVGTVEVATGTLGVKSMGSTFGNPANTFLVDSGATVDFYTSDPGYARNFHGLSGSAIQFVSGMPTFAGNLTLENSSEFVAYGGNGTYPYLVDGTIALNGTAHFVFGDANVIITNVISGTGGFVWDAYNHELFLQAANTYTGPTVINGQILGLTNNGSISHSSLIFLNGATIDVTNRSDTTLTLGSGQTLAGIGTIGGTLTVPAGTILSPGGTNNTLGMVESGNLTGTITATKNVNLNGNTILKLDGSGVNDQVASTTTIAFGGTLTVTNISGASLAVGNSFQIFSAPSLTGSFSSISPSTPGPGLAWDTSQLNSMGFLNVVAGAQGPLITSTVVSSGNLIFSGTGGTPSANYTVFTTTNLAQPNWTPLTTSSFNASGGFSVTNAISTSIPALFYRIN